MKKLPVILNRTHGSNNAGEECLFDEAEAQKLVSVGWARFPAPVQGVVPAAQVVTKTVDVQGEKLPVSPALAPEESEKPKKKG